VNADLVDELEEIVARVHGGGRPYAQQDIDRLRERHVRSRQDLRALASDSDAASVDRQTAMWALGRLRDPEATPVLLEALGAGDPALRAAAARALGELGIENAGARLSMLVRTDAEIEPRRAAAYALGLIGHVPAVPDLVAVLRDSSEPSALRGMVAEALADIGDPTAISALTDALSDTSAEVRFWAVHALGRLGTSEVLEQLGRLTADSSTAPGFGTVADEAARAIAAIHDRETRQR
jgi:HEAT repeat protein